MDNVITAVLRTSSAKNCFLHVSPDLARRLSTLKSTPENHKPAILAFKIEWPSGQMFVSWSGEAIVSNQTTGFNQSAPTVEINRRFAQSHGLQDEQQVVLEHIHSIPSCTSMHVDPVSADDWEILELHAGFLESNFLNQVRVVWCGQVIPIWINKNTSIAIKIKMTEPIADCVMLEEFSEVVVTPRNRTFTTHEQKSLTPHRTSASKYPGKDEIKSVSPKGYKDSHSKNNYVPLPDDVVQQSSAMSDVLDYFKSMFYGDENVEDLNVNERRTANNGEESSCLESVENSTSNEENARTKTCCKSLFEAAKMNLNLRVQLTGQLKTKTEQTVVEVKENPHIASKDPSLSMCSSPPTTIIVPPSSIPLNCIYCGRHSIDLPKDCIGWTKVVAVKKIPSPAERAQLKNGPSKRNEVGKDKEARKEELKDSSDGNPPSKSKSSESQDTIIVKLLLTGNEMGGASHSSTQTSVLQGHAVLPELLQQQLGCLTGSVLHVQSVEHDPRAVRGIVLHPATKDSQETIQGMEHAVVVGAFKAWVSSVSSDECPLVSGVTMTVKVPYEGNTLLIFVSILCDASKPTNPPYFLLCPRALEHVSVAIGDHRSVMPLVESSDVTSKLKCAIEDLGGVSEPFQECVDHLLVSLGCSALSRQLSGGGSTGLASGAMLIHGNSSKGGCGRTSLAHALCDYLHRLPVCAHVVVVECIPLRSKRVETIQKHLQKAFTEAAWHQPSIILLDDLDHVISAPSPTQEIGGEALYRLRLAQVFKDLIANEIANKTRLAVIATSRSRDTLHGSLLSARGCHVFQKFVELSPPSESARMAMLVSMIGRPAIEAKSLNISSVARKTEGFSPKDLSSLTDRAHHFAAARNQQNHKQGEELPFVTDADFQHALAGFKPAALRGVPLHQAGSLGWQDVGGLGTVKETLQETLLWPTKFARLFAKCPLRLRSGLLLYGPPGTGKTLLAGVVAKECGLNFISIKGPELLSKYIGASEQAVRDMFTRAESAKPCILFFDEFDSLAPRRGHDSTGVTDRVVNQLLTQLDGVEGLHGVYVLGATSRPDLIDPALLRPGRLDKCIYCPIPSESDRLEILQALSRDLPLADDVTLQTISQHCHHFTGADLKALLYNAQLEAIHRCTSRLKLYGDILTDYPSGGEQDVKGEQDGGQSTAGGEEKVSSALESQVEGSGQGMVLTRSVVVATVGKGIKHLPTDEAQALQTEIDTLKENRLTSPSLSKSVTTKSIKSTLSIVQSDLVTAVKSMGPSVSEKERLRYQSIYKSFVKSRGGSFAQESIGQGRTTLA